MSKYRGLFTYDVDNHRYLPIEQADGIITNMDYHPGPEPLTKDEKIRKAIRAWADLYGYKFATHRFYTTATGHRWSLLARETQEICLPELDGLGESKDYTIAELCGEEEE